MLWCKEEKRVKRDYNYVCWSDKAIFYVGVDGSVFYMTRGAGEEYLETNLKPSFKSGHITVSIWSCFYRDRMGPLVILEKGGTMTAQRYLETVKEHFIPFYRRMVRKYGPGVVIQEDNASWHKAKLVTDYLDRRRIKRLCWPPQSPDLSPIENLWKQIKIILGKRRYRIKNIGMMERALEEIWPTISKESLLKLNASMPKRLNLCIKNKGESIKY